MINESIMFILGIVVVYLMSFIKPEFILKPLLSIIKQKLSKNSNAISNMLGLKLLESGIYAITYEPDDDPKINEAMVKIKEGFNVLTGEIEKKL